ncbi:E3 ubiquitin-protein ligase RGLG5-like [Amaranthus tricolor]|uniref:E3 ubiquitin-protein ligase RGLG5-like n=1 Tax=Amaranthus tricolor TaxID=29722 RepID=UPI00258EC7D0|nr:E3 ubiquitin-protein ligase RGLG5-like [Amaranthus tricolor]XP_057542590.1 E3 ubiquitin-protein ligase RGLG5-like [Amaranthus tricolor]XP_057542591.1 E3 ubiquitin-protein ligase RGLG5-like [Amaranthus tricolor]XP_057542592.1 E3 ubiquitin-protein ligase RGLG5-like [Amaranthus tricolor]
MGGRSSKNSSRRSFSSSYEHDLSRSYGYPPPSPYQTQPSYQTQPTYTPHHPRYAPSPSPSPRSYAPPPPSNTRPKKTLERKYSRIADNYRTLDEVTAALARAGLESSNLIVGIDFTKSNEWTGAKSFNRRSLHHIGNELNPYEEAISIIGKSLSAFDEDNLIPCYGFGDASSHDQDVFSFYGDDRYCQGFEEVLSRYRQLVPQLRLAGPTSFAPVIEMAMTIVEQSGGQYHVLLIIADGQVTRSVDTHQGNLSPQEQRTIEAIVQASAYPLSIVLVGVGDGPWDMMREFDDNIPSRAFDNFQFVNFTQIMSKKVNTSIKQAEFALSALMEIPSQYLATLELGILGRKTGQCPDRVSLPPPRYDAPSGRSGTKSYSRSSSFQQSAPTYPQPATRVGTTSSSTTAYKGPASSTAPSSTSAYENQLCPICITSSKNMAFGCGHQTCCDCGEFLDACPICRRSIEMRIRLY